GETPARRRSAARYASDQSNEAEGPKVKSERKKLGIDSPQPGDTHAQGNSNNRHGTSAVGLAQRRVRSATRRTRWWRRRRTRRRWRRWSSWRRRRWLFAGATPGAESPAKSFPGAQTQSRAEQTINWSWRRRSK